MVWRGLYCMMSFKMFCVHCKRCQFSHFVESNPYSLTTIFSSFSSVGRHCLIGWWLSHIGWCCHCQPTWANLVSHVTLFHGVVVTLVVQVKEGLYCDYYPTDVFFLLAIEVFGCFHQQADNYVHQCANMVWWAKGIVGLPLLVLCFFYR